MVGTAATGLALALALVTTACTGNAGVASSPAPMAGAGSTTSAPAGPTPGSTGPTGSTGSTSSAGSGAPDATAGPGPGPFDPTSTVRPAGGGSAPTTGATGPPAAGAPATTNTSVRTGTDATAPAAGRGVLFGGITVTSCPPSPTTCEDSLLPVAGTVRAEQLDPPPGQPATVAGTETDGLFNLELPAGRWRVSVYSPSVQPCPTRDVTLAAGQKLTVTFTCQRRP